MGAVEQTLLVGSDEQRDEVVRILDDARRAVYAVLAQSGVTAGDG